MQEKKPGGVKTGQDESSRADDSGYETKQSPEELQNKADDQSYADQKGEVNQPVRDKRAFDNKQALADKQVDVPIAPPKFADPVVGESWSAVNKSSNKSGTPNDEILKKPVLSLDNTAQHLDQLTPATDAQAATNWGIWVSMQAGLDPSTAGTRPADDGTNVGLPGGGSGSGVMDPGTVIVGIPGIIDEAPNPAATINPDIIGQPYEWGHLMDPLYVLEPVAITLSGGGAFGAFEVGALDFIYNRFMGSDEGVAAGFSRPRPDIVTGTSIGAVNGAWIAQGDGSMEELKSLWFDLLKNDDMFRLNGAFHDLVGDPGDPFGPGIGKILADTGWGFLATGLLPFGFLFFHQVRTDISNLYTALNAQSSVYNLGPITGVLTGRERYWSPTGPGLRGAGIAVARDLRGHRIVFARGYDDMLYVRWQLDVNPISASTPWSRWKSLGGPISSDPVAYTTGYPWASTDNPLRVGVIARLADEQRYGGRTLDVFNDITHVDPVDPTHYDPFGGWADVPPPPPPVPHYSSQPIIIQRSPDGRAWAFCCDDHRLSELSPNLSHRSFFSRWEGGSWGSWTLFGQDWMNFAGNITGCSYLDGTEVLELFVRRWDFEIMYNFARGGSAPGNWEFWGEEGKAIKATSDLLVVLADDLESMVDVFWRGTDGQVWTRRKVGGRGSWEIKRNLGGMITSNLCSGRNSSGIRTIFARGLDDNLYELRQTSVNGDWPANAWNPVGAPPGLTLLADPYTLAATPTTLTPTGGIEVYAVASDHSVWTILQQPDGTYTDWVPLGGKVWTGIQLRMSTVALETGEDRFVNEAGRFAGTLERIASGDDGDISFSRTAGIIASSSLPVLFPPVRLNGRTWVNGGVRRGVPIGAAIDAGAKSVIAISTVPTTISPVGRIQARKLDGSDAGGLIEDYSHAGIINIAMRALMTLVDAMHWAEIAPETNWPVRVSVIQPTFKIKGGDAIDPGLIRINYAYGWMRAYDILTALPEDRQAAIASTDRIINARCAAWGAEAAFREQYLIATMGDYRAGTSPDSLEPQLRAAREAAHLAQISLGQSRNAKWELKDALIARRNLGFPLDPESPTWSGRFEKFAPLEQWGLGWERLLPASDSPFDKITITVTIDNRVGGSVVAAPPPTLDG